MRFYDYPDAEEIREFFQQTGKKIDELNEKLNTLIKRTYMQGQLDNINSIDASLQTTILESSLREANTRLTVVHEPFIDTKSLDVNALKKPAAQVVAECGVLTLQRSGGQSIKPQYIRITGGNGLPGNTHQVDEDTKLYLARDGLHNNISHLVDGNHDTWFEYERLLALPGTKYTSTLFAEGLNWLEFQWAPLEFDIEMELDELQPLGALAVYPFLPPFPGYRPADMMVVIDDGQGQRQHFGRINLKENIFVPFLPQSVRKIKASFRQTTGIKVTVGLPQKPLPLTVTGVFYSPTAGITYPVYDASSNQLQDSDRELIAEYYNEPASETTQTVRYMVGLREIRPIAYTYAEESEFVFHTIPISPYTRAVRLEGVYTVPEVLYRQKLVKWSLSFDDGATWIEVAANDVDSDLFKLPREVRFGRYTPVFLHSERAAYITGQPESVRVKIELSRPTDIDMAEYFTPIVSDCTIVCEEEDVI